MNWILILKFTLAPSLVALASLAGRRWGLRIGGAIGGFPVVVGPILFFFALEQGAAFAASASVKALWSVLPFGIFCVATSWACLRIPLWASVLLGWALFLGVSWAGVDRHDSLLVTSVLAFVCTIIARAALPVHKDDPQSAIAPGPWDIPLRMSATLALLLSVTAAAGALGPSWSGALAAFPVASSVLGIFSHLSNGKKGPGMLYRGSLLGCFSYLTFCAVLALTLEPWGIATGFGIATLSAVCVQIGVLFFSRPRN